MQIKLVNVHYNDSDKLCATLTNGNIGVQCEDIAWWDELADAEMDALFDEWRELADAGEDGYTFVA